MTCLSPVFLTPLLFIGQSGSVPSIWQQRGHCCRRGNSGLPVHDLPLSFFVPSPLRLQPLYEPLCPQHAMAWASPPNATSQIPFDPLVATASDLQQLLEEGSVTSEELVSIYLARIEKHNRHGMRLNAIISTAPRDTVLAAARSLDRERRTLGKRGPLHGIPIVVKVRVSGLLQRRRFFFPDLLLDHCYRIIFAPHLLACLPLAGRMLSSEPQRTRMPPSSRESSTPVL